MGSEEEQHDIVIIDGGIVRLATALALYRDEVFRCLRRSDIFEALANGVPAKSIRFGCQVVAVGTDPTHLTFFLVVHLNDGTTIKAKL